MATATIGFLLVNKHFQVEALQNEIINKMKKTVKYEMRMASPSSRRKIISQAVISGGSGSLVQDGLVYRQNFSVRSFEIGFDRKLSLAALTNYLQDTALEQCRVIGIWADDFGSTPEMSRQDLIWVVCALQIVVDSYPSWLDVVEVDTWFYPSGQNSIRRDWIVRDGKTGNTLARATSVCVLMNKKTRKLSKLKEEIREEFTPHIRNCDPVIVKDSRKLLRLDVDTADYVRKGEKVSHLYDVSPSFNKCFCMCFFFQCLPCLIDCLNLLSTTA
ncbi:hypothetical protein MANES_11G051500v8 [Manihot esculenta]|uniref:Uncharacterized protein n=1 Tax=Manihot esculenta TaxID=3983 RepID=A0ACB7GV19_MANES|nr:hypothetical protein MANES_11G051500v8 [Manihot esculenta]